MGYGYGYYGNRWNGYGRRSGDSYSQDSSGSLILDAEDQLSNYLDEKVYNGPFFTNVRRMSMNLAYRSVGCDVILDVPSYNMKDIVVDEVSQPQYYQQSLPTYSFNVTYVGTSGRTEDGTLLGGNYRNSHYLVLWPQTSVRPKDFRSKDVSELRFAMVSRQKLRAFLTAKGFDEEKLRDADEHIRKTMDQQGTYLKDEDLDFWFYYAPQQRDKPINLVMRRKLLFDISDFYYDKTKQIPRRQKPSVDAEERMRADLS